MTNDELKALEDVFIKMIIDRDGNHVHMSKSLALWLVQELLNLRKKMSENSICSDCYNHMRCGECECNIDSGNGS